MSEIDFSKMEGQPVFTVAQLDWSGKLGRASLRGSYVGSYAQSDIQYHIHDHVSRRHRYKVYRNGLSYIIGQAATLDCAKEIAQAHFEVTINAAISPAVKYEILRLRAENSELVEAGQKFLASIDWDENGPTFHHSPGCIRCTDGTTPNHLNTGLCGYHEFDAALKRARGGA